MTSAAGTPESMPRFALELHVGPNELPLHASAELDDEPIVGQLVAVEGCMWKVWGVRPTRANRSWSDLFVCALEEPHPWESARRLFQQPDLRN